MVKIITALEADVLAQALEDAQKILDAEGYEDEGNACGEALGILQNLKSKRVEDVIK